MGIRLVGDPLGSRPVGLRLDFAELGTDTTLLDLRAAVGGRRFERIVLDRSVTELPDPARMLVAMVESLEPAGRISLRADGPVALPLVRRLLDGGGHSAHVEDGEVVVRPFWSAELLARSRNLLESSRGRDPDVVFAVLGDPGVDLAGRIRASVESRLEVAIWGQADLGRFADLDPTVPVVLIEPTTLVEPRWVSELLRNLRRTGKPCGLRVVGADGRIVHAGGDGSGRAFAAGAAESERLTWVAGQRELLPPLAGSASMVATVLAGEAAGMLGTYLAAVPARDSDAVCQPGSHAAAREVLGPVAVVLTERVDRRLVVGELDLARPGPMLEQIVQRGFTPLLATDLPRAAAVSLGAHGVLVPDLSSSRLDQLVRELDVRAVLVRDESSLGLPVQAVSISHPDVAITWIGRTRPPRELRERLDLLDPRPTDGLPAEAFEVLTPPATPSRVPSFSGRGRPGLVSVVIPVHGRWDLTDRCLASLRARTPTPIEIVVVDNASPDDTARGLAARNDVVVVSNDSNRGFPEAVNQGIDVSSGELVCVLNNDTVVTEGWLEEMVGVLDRPGTAMVGPRSNSIAGRQVVAGAPSLVDETAAVAWAENWSAQRRATSWPTGTLIGFCLLARRSTLVELGGFDEAFGTGNFEDIELCDRIRDSGGELRVADGAVVLHHGSATFDVLGTDYHNLIRGAHRRYGAARSSGCGLVTAVVLGSGDPGECAATVGPLTAIADSVLVLEPLAAVTTAVSCSHPADLAVTTVAADWRDEGQVAPLLDGIGSELVLVVAAGETVRFDDWGAVRAELDAFDGTSLGVRTPIGVEVRVHRGVAGVMEVIGEPGVSAMTSLEIGAGR